MKINCIVYFILWKFCFDNNNLCIINSVKVLIYLIKLSPNKIFQQTHLFNSKEKYLFSYEQNYYTNQNLSFFGLSRFQGLDSYFLNHISGSEKPSLQTFLRKEWICWKIGTLSNIYQLKLYFENRLFSMMISIKAMAIATLNIDRIQFFF